MLSQQGLKQAYPIFFFLIAMTVILLLINAFTPLAPFVYSLF